MNINHAWMAWECMKKTCNRIKSTTSLQATAGKARGDDVSFEPLPSHTSERTIHEDGPKGPYTRKSEDHSLNLEDSPIWIFLSRTMKTQSLSHTSGMVYWKIHKEMACLLFHECRRIKWTRVRSEEFNLSIIARYTRLNRCDGGGARLPPVGWCCNLL